MLCSSPACTVTLSENRSAIPSAVSRSTERFRVSAPLSQTSIAECGDEILTQAREASVLMRGKKRFTCAGFMVRRAFSPVPQVSDKPPARSFCAEHRMALRLRLPECQRHDINLDRSNLAAVQVVEVCDFALMLVNVLSPISVDIFRKAIHSPPMKAVRQAPSHVDAHVPADFG